MLLTTRTIEYYEENAASLVPEYEMADLDNVYQVIKSELSPKGVVLEVGGGSGRDANYLITEGYSVIFSDASVEMVRKAISFHPNLETRSLILKLPDQLPFRSDSFDSIVAVAVLMHLTAPDIVNTVSEFHRALKIGGKAVISTPSARDDMASQSRDHRGRLMTSVNMPELIERYFSGGFRIVSQVENIDGMNRTGITWKTCCVEKL